MTIAVPRGPRASRPLVVEYREIMEGAGVPEEDWAFAVGSGQYANMRLLQKALADYADPDAPLDGAAALEAMFQVDGENLEGLLAYPVSYSPDVLNRTVPCYGTYLKAPDGTLENPLGGLATQCFPEQ